MDKTQQKSGTGAGSANGLPQPIQDGLGATMLGPHNVPGDETRRFLEMFRSNRYADVSLAQWLALTPPELVQAHLNVDQQTMGALSGHKDKPIVVK